MKDAPERVEMVCAHCREENPADNTYCGKCGRALSGEAPDPPRYPARESLVRREIAVVTAGVLLLLAAAFGLWFLFFLEPSPASVVEHFIEADRAGALEQQAQYVSSRPDARLILAAVQTFRQQAGASLFQQYRILSSSSDAHSASVNVEITLTGAAMPRLLPAPGTPGAAPRATQFVVSFILVREENVWKIDPAQTLASVGGTLLANGYGSISPNLPKVWPPPNAPWNPGLPPITVTPAPAPPPAPSGSSI